MTTAFILLLLAFRASAETTEEPEAPVPTCDPTDEANYWLDNLGSSTQFRIYDLCDDNKFIKVKLDSLTEVDVAGKDTQQKVSSFASAQGGWEEGEGAGLVESDCPIGEGGSCIYNVFVASGFNKADGAELAIETWFAVDPLVVSVPREGGGNENITVSSGTVKMSVNITDWPFLAAENQLEFCIGLMTNNAGTVNEEDEGRTFRLSGAGSGAEVQNLDVASCEGTGSTDINVTITQDTNGNNHLDICYLFDACDGDIVYDPFFTMIDGSSAHSVVVMFIAVFLSVICV